VFPNVRIAGNRTTLHFCAKYKDQNASNAMVFTSQKITANLGGVAK